MRIGLAEKLIRRIAARDPLCWTGVLRCYVCQFCGGMGDSVDEVSHKDDCIWAAAHELVSTAT